MRVGMSRPGQSMVLLVHYELTVLLGLGWEQWHHVVVRMFDRGR